MSRDLTNVWISECDTLNARCFSTDICKRTLLGISYSYGKHIQYYTICSWNRGYASMLALAFMILTLTLPHGDQ